MSDVYATDSDRNIARNGIYLQLGATTRLIEIYGSLANALEVLGLGDFIENQVEVIASKEAWVREMENRLR